MYNSQHKLGVSKEPDLRCLDREGQEIIVLTISVYKFDFRLLQTTS